MKTTLSVLMTILILTSAAWSQGAAYVLEVSGPVEYKDAEHPDGISLKSGTMLGEDATIMTGKGSSVGLVYKDNTTKKLGPEVEFEVGSRTLSATQSDDGMWGSLSKPAATRNSLFGGVEIQMPVDTRVLMGDLTLRWTCSYVDPLFEVSIKQNSSGDTVFTDTTELRKITIPLEDKKFERGSRYTWTVRDPNVASDPGVSGTFVIASEDEEKDIKKLVRDIRGDADDETLGLVAAALHLQHAGYAAEADAKLTKAIESVEDDVAYRRLQEMLYAGQRQ